MAIQHLNRHIDLELREGWSACRVVLSCIGSMADKEKEKPDAPDFDAHRKWKKLSAPMYDWMTNHHMTWPGLACRCGLSVLCTACAKHTQPLPRCNHTLRVQIRPMQALRCCKVRADNLLLGSGAKPLRKLNSTCCSSHASRGGGPHTAAQQLASLLL